MNSVQGSGKSPLSCCCPAAARTRCCPAPASDSGRADEPRGLRRARSRNRGACRGFREAPLLCERLNCRGWGKAPAEASRVLCQKYLRRETEERSVIRALTSSIVLMLEITKKINKLKKSIMMIEMITLDKWTTCTNTSSL